MKKLFLAVLLFVGGCSATGTKFAEIDKSNDSDAIVYIYRPSSYINSGVVPYVYINDAKKQKLKNGSYQAFVLMPGFYTITLDGNIFEWPRAKEEVYLDLEENDTKYLRFGSAIADIFIMGTMVSGSTSVDLLVVEDEFALDEIRLLRTPQ